MGNRKVGDRWRKRKSWGQMEEQRSREQMDSQNSIRQMVERKNQGTDGRTGKEADRWKERN